ncbi:MAG: PRC-barrel domain-containing protein [Leifsonia sp.]
MEANDNDMLVELSDTDETIKLGDEDIRSYSVKDTHGANIGKVDDLLVDLGENKVRFLVVGSGGFLGMGETKSFIPIDAINRITKDEVHIDQTREQVAEAPPYDPALVNNRRYHENTYGYYGYGPYWAAGYVYPGLPFRI